jgi:hypothetical protein
MKKLLLLMLAAMPLAGFAQGNWFLNAKLGGSVTTSHPREGHWFGANGITTIPQYGPAATLGAGINLGHWQVGGNLETGVMRAGMKVPGYQQSNDVYIPGYTSQHSMPYAALFAYGNRRVSLKVIDLYAGVHVGGLLLDNAGNSVSIYPGTYRGVAGGAQVGVIKNISKSMFLTAEVGARQMYLYTHTDERVVDDYIEPAQTHRFSSTSVPFNIGIGFRL